MPEAPNKDLGPCVVIWDETGDNVTFNKTFGGVFFRYEELQQEIQRDQEGRTHVDGVTVGVVNPEVEVPMTQEEVEKMEICFARNSVLAATYLKVKNPVGAAIFPLTRQLVVKPIVNGVISTTNTEWLYVHRTFPRITMEQAYDNSGQRTVKVIFKGYVDDNSPRVGEMWRYGPAA